MEWLILVPASDGEENANPETGLLVMSRERDMDVANFKDHIIGKLALRFLFQSKDEAMRRLK